MHPPHVLVVDDDTDQRHLLQTQLSTDGYRVSFAATAQEALDALAQDPPRLITLDLRLPDMPGEELCRHIRARSQVPIVVVSLYGHEELKANLLDGELSTSLSRITTNESIVAIVLELAANTGVVKAGEYVQGNSQFATTTANWAKLLREIDWRNWVGAPTSLGSALARSYAQPMLKGVADGLAASISKVPATVGPGLVRGGAIAAIYGAVVAGVYTREINSLKDEIGNLGGGTDGIGISVDHDAFAIYLVNRSTVDSNIAKQGIGIFYNRANFVHWNLLSQLPASLELGKRPPWGESNWWQKWHFREDEIWAPQPGCTPIPPRSPTRPSPNDIINL